MATEGTIKYVDGKVLCVTVKDGEQTVECRNGVRITDGLGNDAKTLKPADLHNGDRVQLRGDPIHTVVVLASKPAGVVELPATKKVIDSRKPHKVEE